MKRIYYVLFSLVLLAAMIFPAINYPVPAQAAGVAYTIGDVFAGVGGGLIKHFSPTGTLLDTLDTGAGSTEDTGMAFDQSSNLYATVFEANNLYKFDNMGNLIGPFGSGYSGNHPESIVFDIYGNAYVGQADGSHQVLKFSPSGTLLASYSPASEDRGTDWIDLAKDQCTLHYTSEGSSVKTFNVCTNTQGSDFATGLPSPSYAHRIRSNGEELVASTTQVERLNSSGGVIQTYTPGGTLLFALNLDPDGKTFWTADLPTGTIWRIDIASGAIVTTFSAGPVSPSLAGLTVAGELTALPTLTLTPSTDTKNVGQTETMTAQLTNELVPAGNIITFTVTGANPASGTATTDATGVATFAYTGSNAGNDTVVATTTLTAGYPIPVPFTSNTSAITWNRAPTSLSFSSTSPTTQHFNDPVTLSATLTSTITGAAIPGETLTFTLDSQAAGTGVTDATGTASCTITPVEAAGAYTLAVAFAGDKNYLPSSANEPFKVTLEDTQLTSQMALQVFVVGSTATLSATLTDPPEAGELVATPIGNLVPALPGPVPISVTMTLGSGPGAQSCSASTNASGVATCSFVVSPTVGNGPVTITDTFVDPTNHFSPANFAQHALVAAFPDHGSFVIGDVTEDTASGTTNPVNFWGPVHFKTNSFSALPAGQKAEPPQMKGWINNLSVFPPTIDTLWTTNPGNSSNPPVPALPAYMATIVASTATSQGSTVSGNTVEIVVIQTNLPSDEYSNAPGHEGTGPIVAELSPFNGLPK